MQHIYTSVKTRILCVLFQKHARMGDLKPERLATGQHGVIEIHQQLYQTPADAHSGLGKAFRSLTYVN